MVAAHRVQNLLPMVSVNADGTAANGISQAAMENFLGEQKEAWVRFGACFVVCACLTLRAPPPYAASPSTLVPLCAPRPPLLLAHPALEAVSLPQRAQQVRAQVRHKVVVSHTLRPVTHGYGGIATALLAHCHA